MHRFFGLLFLALFGATLINAEERSTVSPSPVDPLTGKTARVNLPKEQHLKNLTSPRGQGCCAYASLDMASDVHCFEPMKGVLKDRLGGAWVNDLDAAFRRRAPGFTDYVQTTGDTTVSLMDWALRSGRPSWVTYDYDDSPIYRNAGGVIYHMVILVHLDAAAVPNARACIIDNNRPGFWVWMSRGEFLRRHRLHRGWAGAYLLPPAPPVPVN